jgi:gliding motility-associated-like protein
MKILNCFLFACGLILSNSTTAQITSTFDTDADGWTFSNNGTPITVNHNASNGNPGGFVSTAPYSANSTATSQGWFAPAKFLGSHVAKSYGMNLRFDLQQSVAGTASSGQGDVRIVGNSGFDIVFSFPVKPAVAPAWSSYTLKLDETGGWRVNSTGGALATQADVIRALTNITALEIRGTYITNASYVSGIDNVVLEQRTLDPSPVITSFAPMAGIPGVSISINGSNFGATAAQNTVYFGTTKGTITSVSATRIDVTVPAGAQYGPVSVVNLTTGLRTKTNQSFNPLFDNNKDFGGEIIPASLSRGLNTIVQNGTEITSSTSSQGGTMGAGDIDGDGWVDLVGSELGTQTIYVFRNLGTGGTVGVSSFAAPASLSVASLPLPGVSAIGMGEITVTDVDSDGRLDITTIASKGEGHLVVYRNTSTAGSISFASPVFFSYGYYSSQLRTTSADFDGDGRIDFVHTTGTSPGGIWLNQNLSTPGNVLFGYAQYIGPNNGRNDLSVGDLNGDGKPELIATRGVFEIHENNSVPGTISFNTPILLTGTSIVNFAIADLDADNKADLIWGGGAQVYFSRNIYSGGALSAASFDTPFQVPHLASNTYHIAVSDINGDGKPDVLATGDIDMAIFQNRGGATLSAASFTNSTLYQASVGATTRIYPSAPVIADLDGDNKPEVMLSHTNYNISAAAKGIYIFHNESFPAPVVNSISPSSGNASTNVTLTGDFMFTGNVAPTIRLGGVSAVVNSPTNTSSVTQVPAGAMSGKFAITNHGLTGFSSAFNLTFATDRVINASSFGPSIDFALANAVRDAIDVADFDDDGKVEVLVVDNFSTGKIFKNTHATAGQPINASSLTVESTTYGSGINLKALDIDGDGKIDLNSGFNLFQNTSTSSISFATGVTTRPTGFNYAATADFNKDGKTDFALTDGTALIRVHSNQSSRGTYNPIGNFSPFSEAVVGLAKVNGAGGIVAADFDGDGYDDLIATNTVANSITIYRNEKMIGPITTSSFSLVGNNSVPGLQPYNITASDFDGDGKVDLAVTYFNSAFISIYRNTGSAGTISFAAAVDVTCLNKGYSIASQDLDGDGKAEIVVIHQPNPGPGSFSVFKNTSTSGTVSFATPINYALGRNPQALSIADINSDQKPDILVVATGGSTAPANALMVFENKISSLLITITQQPASPYYACEGGTATFTTAASGTTNITYQWQKFDGSVFVNLVNSTTFSGVTSPTLTISNVSSSESGEYQCVISGDFAAPVTTDAADLVFNSLPSPPDVVNGVSCGPGVVLLTASGGSPGDYRWYSGSPLTLIAGEQNETLITPSLTDNTTYHVSLTDTFCESVPVQVTAIISTPPAKPVITASVTPVGGEITACESTVLTLSAPAGFSDYQWFDTSGYPFASTQTVTILDSDVYSVLVVNADGCSSEESDALTVTIVPEPCTNTAPVITTSTLSTTLGQSVSVDLLSLISDADGNLVLSSLTIVQQPQSGASASINGTNLLIDYNGLSFTGLDVIRISVCDLFGECTEQTLEINVIGEIEIFNAVSPNGDDKNPYFRIENIEALEPDNTVTIYNRWGSKVFEVENYKEANAFRGLNQNGNELPSGTYFYKIFFKSTGKTTNGFLVLKR